MKKNIIFVSTALWVGGIESALVNLLNSIDYNKFNATCLITYNYTDMAHRLPEECKLLIADRDKLVSFKEPYKYSRLFHLLEKPQNASRLRLLIWKILCFLFKGIEAHLYALYVKKQMAENKFDTAIIYSDVVCETAVKGIDADKYIMFYHHGAMRKVYHDKYGYKKSKKIVAVSQSQADALKEFRPQYKNKIIAINNIIDVDDIKKRSKEKTDVEFTKDKFNIVSCGRLSPVKGLHFAVEAVARLVEEGYTDINWYIVGGGPIEKEIKEQIVAHKMEKHIFMLGMKSNPYPYMEKCDLFIQPSIFEGYSLSIMEAKILRTPILATYAAAGNQVENGIDGFLCDTNTESVYENLLSLYKNRDMLENCKKVLMNFDFDSINQKIISAIEKML